MNNVMVSQQEKVMSKVVVPELLAIRIPNWKKFNPRADRVNFSWFRFENNFFHDQSVFLLSPDQKLLYIFILCEASKKNSEYVKIAPRYVCAVIGMIEQLVRDSLRYISDLGLIVLEEIHTPINPCGALTSECRHDDVTEPPKGRTTNETNVTNVTRRDEQKRVKASGIRLEYSEDFESVWVLYERKGEKKAAYAEYQKLNLSDDEKLSLSVAIRSYLKEKPEPKWRKDFERFLLTDWRENLKPRPLMNGGAHPKTQERMSTYETWKNMREQREQQQEGGNDDESAH